MTIKEIAEIANVSERTVYRWIDKMSDKMSDKAHHKDYIDFTLLKDVFSF